MELIAALLLFIGVICQLGRCQESSFFERPGVLASDILRARGFLAEDKYFTSADGYVIRITRGRNPLINNGSAGGLAHRTPLLFIHGILESDNVFLINSFKASPRDLSGVDLAAADTADLLAASEPSARSLPLLALNLGHEVWIMSRRGFPGSQQMVGDGATIAAGSRPTQSAPSAGNAGLLGSTLGALLDYGAILQQLPFSFDRKFWNFSFDEQAQYDFPQAVEFVLEQTGRPKVALVSHSAGGAIALMALSQYPSLADRIESAIFWAQGFSLGYGDAFNRLTALAPLLETYTGSVPPSFTSTQLQALAGLFCTSRLAQRTLCEGVADLVFGDSGGQEPLRPEFINSLLYPSSAHELAQNLQMIRAGDRHMLHYNYGPPYNASAIRLSTMSFYTGATDALVSPSDVKATLTLLKVPYEFHYIDTAFNHNGYFYHENNAQLAIIPSMREIQQFAAMQQNRHKRSNPP